MSSDLTNTHSFFAIATKYPLVYKYVLTLPVEERKKIIRSFFSKDYQKMQLCISNWRETNLLIEDTDYRAKTRRVNEFPTGSTFAHKHIKEFHSQVLNRVTAGAPFANPRYREKCTNRLTYPTEYTSSLDDVWRSGVVYHWDTKQGTGEIAFLSEVAHSVTSNTSTTPHGTIYFNQTQWMSGGLLTPVEKGKKVVFKIETRGNFNQAVNIYLTNEKLSKAKISPNDPIGSILPQYTVTVHPNVSYVVGHVPPEYIQKMIRSIYDSTAGDLPTNNSFTYIENFVVYPKDWFYYLNYTVNEYCALHQSFNSLRKIGIFNSPLFLACMSMIRLFTCRANLSPLNIPLFKLFVNLLCKSFAGYNNLFYKSDDIIPDDFEQTLAVLKSQLIHREPIVSFFPTLFFQLVDIDVHALESHNLPELTRYSNLIFDLADYIYILFIYGHQLNIIEGRIYTAIQLLIMQLTRIIEHILHLLDQFEDKLENSALPDPANAEKSEAMMDSIRIQKQKMNSSITFLTLCKSANGSLSLFPSMAEMFIPSDQAASCFHNKNLPVLTDTFTSFRAHVHAHSTLLKADVFNASMLALAYNCYQLDYAPSVNTLKQISNAYLYHGIKLLGRAYNRYLNKVTLILQVYKCESGAFEANPVYPVTILTERALEIMSLVCITTSQDRSKVNTNHLYWGYTTSIDPELHAKGIVSIAIVQGSTDNLANELQTNYQQDKSNFSMLFETKVFFTGYQPVASTLMDLYYSSTPLAISKVIVSGQLEPLVEGVVPFHYRKTYSHLINELKETTNLDMGQLKTLHALLDNQIVLVQGPPGSGKTFIGVKIVELLIKLSQSIALGEALFTADRSSLVTYLSNYKLGSVPKGNRPTASMILANRQIGPIVILTYKNQALDTFLEHILELGLWCEGCRLPGECSCIGKDKGLCCINCCTHKPKLIRVGEGSESNILRPHTLHYQLSQEGPTSQIKSLKNKQQGLLQHYRGLTESIARLEAHNISEDELLFLRVRIAKVLLLV